MEKPKLFFYNSLGGRASQPDCVRAVSNFPLPERENGHCAFFCTPLIRWVRVGEKCSPIILDPIRLGDGWTRRRVVNSDPRVRALLNRPLASCLLERRCVLLENGGRWVVVSHVDVADAEHYCLRRV
ncbi:MAG TPA: hypothetical protein PLR18_03780 [bacterium]|nr:hypothetical protein [bacterium]